MNNFSEKAIQDITEEIYAYKGELKKQRDRLETSGQMKAEGIRNYHRARAIIMMQMKAGKKVILDNEVIENSPVTIIPAISKGICFQELYDKELAEATYKAIVVQIECLRAELNALQSIKRVQESIIK